MKGHGGLPRPETSTRSGAAVATDLVAHSVVPENIGLDDTSGPIRERALKRHLPMALRLQLATHG